MKSTRNTARNKKPPIDRLVKYLIDIIEKYSIQYTVKDSNNPGSQSKYIQFLIDCKEHTIRISDHPLPNYHKLRNKGEYLYDLCPSDFKKGKFIVTGLFRDKNVEKHQVVRWGNNIKKMADEYNATLIKQKDPESFKRWTRFFYTLNATSTAQKWKLHKMPIHEILLTFKLPLETPTWINRILVKYL